jgi:hypothetical protein
VQFTTIERGVESLLREALGHFWERRAFMMCPCGPLQEPTRSRSALRRRPGHRQPDARWSFFLS